MLIIPIIIYPFLMSLHTLMWHGLLTGLLFCRYSHYFNSFVSKIIRCRLLLISGCLTIIFLLFSREYFAHEGCAAYRVGGTPSPLLTFALDVVEDVGQHLFVTGDLLVCWGSWFFETQGIWVVGRGGMLLILLEWGVLRQNNWRI
jgi:hypothetical protein